jgi:hypothetical protein
LNGGRAIAAAVMEENDAAWGDVTEDVIDQDGSGNVVILGVGRPHHDRFALLLGVV